MTLAVASKSVGAATAERCHEELIKGVCCMESLLKTRPGVHPGEILREEFGADPVELARQLALDAEHIAAIFDGRCRISDRVAGLLAAHYGTSIEFWLNLQRAADAKLG